MSSPKLEEVSTPAIHSMTGFARVSGRVSDTLAFTLSLKSVNHRFLDLHMRMPGGTEQLEMRLRRYLKEKLGRGHVEVTLSLERSASADSHYNHAIVEAYVEAFKAASKTFGLSGEPDLNVVLRLPGVLSADAGSPNEDMDALEQAVLAQMDTLIASLESMRAQEGQALTDDMLAGMDRLRAMVEQVATLREDVQRAYFERVRERISTMLNGSCDQERILQEAAMLAERSDVEEEITRLTTHIDHFQSLLRAGGEVGKKLDFLLQEMNREANTLLSKTSGISGNGPRITEFGLGMKAEIEKAREQVQNLE